MSPKRWILLLIFYISYLMFGASIYYHIEHSLEKQQRSEDLKERVEINDFLMDLMVDLNTTTQDEALYKIGEYCEKPVTAPTSEVLEIPYTWTFYHSFFFVFTVCSTVGYGNLSPSTTLGRMIMILYSIIGLPVNGILFAGLGEFFGKTFVAIYRRYKKYKMSANIHYVPLQLGLVTTVIIALVPGIGLFVLLPSWIFTIFEGWPYSTAIYYSYVTMTTIGFGDFVPTFEPQQPSEFGGWFVAYEIFVIIWMIFSLGYLVMIMTYITRGLQSKRLARLEQQLSTNIKATQNRIWNGVTKDVGNLRRILNEMYIMRFKPIYTEPNLALLDRRSISCPDLTIYRIDSWPESIYKRKRTYSECYDATEVNAVEGTPMIRAYSDTMLDKIDKQRSFETAESFRQTTELLAKVVTALATVKAPPPDEYTSIASGDMYGGYHGFSDSQILASEWSFTSNQQPPLKPRGRACSDFNIQPKQPMRRPTTIHANEWTWSGDNNQIQEAINQRHFKRDSDNLYRSSFRQPTSKDYIVNMDDDEYRKQSQIRTKKFSIPDGLRKIFPFRKQSSTQDALPAGKSTGRKISIMSVPEAQHHAPPLDYYSTVTASASPTYFQNGKATTTANGAAQMFSADSKAPAKLHVAAANGIAQARRGSMYDAQQTSVGSTSAYQRNATAAASRKRRESMFTPNPAISTRRGSMFPPSSAAAALSQRRGSLYNTERRGSTASVMNMPPVVSQRRGSLFPTGNARRPSMFSATSEEDMDVLENTTVADLIRAIEMVHTQSVIDEAAAAAPSNTHVGFVDVFSSNSDKKKKRKMGDAGLNTPDLPPILSLLGGDNQEALTAVAANRLYARRATIVGTSSPYAGLHGNSPASGSTANVLTRRRKSSVQILDPPPSYSEQEPTTNAQTPPAPAATPAPASTAGITSTAASVVSKFKRRFSIRPTSLAIPPGKAPPPGSTLSPSQPTTPTMPMTPAPITPAYSSQTALQRRLSLRPSPLARELNIQTQPATGSPTDFGPASPTSPTGSIGGVSASSTTRLLPPANAPAVPPRPSTGTTSSTFSPLSRIVQISQAQRKSSNPTDSFTLEQNKKSDNK